LTNDLLTEANDFDGIGALGKRYADGAVAFEGKSRARRMAVGVDVEMIEACCCDLQTSTAPDNLELSISNSGICSSSILPLSAKATCPFDVLCIFSISPL